MKDKTLFFVLLFCITILLSCKTSEPGSVSCPDISLKKSKYAKTHRTTKARYFVAHKTRAGNYKRTAAGKTNESIPILAFTLPADSLPISKIEYNKGLIASNGNIISLSESNELSGYKPASAIMKGIPGTSEAKHTLVYPAEQSCDTIILRSGGTLIGKVEEIGQTEIKYRKCNNLTGPVISVLKSNVSSIHYTNGTRDYFDASDISIPRSNNVFEPLPVSEPVIKNEGLGIAGFLSGLVGLFIASIPLGIIAIVFGGISLSKIKRNPRMYRGRGLAIAAIILGIVDVVGMILVLGSM